VLEHGRLGGHHRRHLRGDIDVLSGAAVLAFGQRHQRADGGLGPGVQVALRYGDCARRPVVIAGHQQCPAGRHDRQVTCRPVGFRSVLPEWRDRHHHQPGVDAGEGAVAEADALQVSGRERFDQHVALAGEVAELFAPCLRPGCRG
jgi:hypothetical protein